jgi:imidazolonepropionase-like amidohydrolase
MARRRPIPLLLLVAACSHPSANNMGTDAGTSPDAGSPDTQHCSNAPVTGDACAYTAGSDALLVRASIAAPTGILENGELLIGSDGKILCAACDCSAHAEAATASVIACPNALVTASLINTHDHITYTDAPPQPHPNEVYEHRNEWRKGLDGHTAIPSISNQGGNSGIWWGELRNVMAGTTSINGSGAAQGLARNLDKIGVFQEGLNQGFVRYSTFPLNDTDGRMINSGCTGYSAIDSTTDSGFSDAVAYTPHVAEGINQAAHNEFLCLSSTAAGGHDVMLSKTAVIHGVGLLASDMGLMAKAGASLIWSPRSNIDLYGDTARVVTAKNLGINIALGPDWTISGSMNMLRELRCASEFNQRNLGGFLSDRDLFEMATINGARALKADMHLGALMEGLEADIAIWSAKDHTAYRAVLDANPQDVLLVMRSGLPLFGDASLMAQLPKAQTGCEKISVCGVDRSICAERETQTTVAQMKAAIAASSYDLFFCDTPPNEPTCVPYRPMEYMGMPTANDKDGDGVPDSMDDCPSIFNPARPFDVNGQADADGDMIGDACDPCPLDPSQACSPHVH